MNNRDDYQDIYEKLQAETDRPLPESLQPAAIAELVDGAELQPKKRPIARYASLAAVLVFVVLASVVGRQLSDGAPRVQAHAEPNAAEAQDELSDEHLRGAASYAEIEQFFLEQQKEYKKSAAARDRQNIFSFGAKSAESSDGAAISDNMNGQIVTGTAGGTSEESASGTAADGADYGQTNTQVEAVDEADILKNDGKYLYIVRTKADSSGKSADFVDIVDIQNPQAMQSVATVQSAFDTDGTDAVIQNLYLNGDTLTVISCVYADTANEAESTAESFCYNNCYTSAQTTAAEVYDITDRTAPRLRFSYAVDGALLSSRMTDSTLLLMTNYQVPLYKNETDLKNACVPCYYAGSEKLRFPIQDVKLIEGAADSSYLTVSLLDTEAGSPTPEVKAVLGGGSNVYCSTDTLLVANTDTSKAVSDLGNGVVSFDSSKPATRLFAFDLLNGADYKGSARIEGTVLNQFSMDAHNGYYRIATTASDGSIITVLDESLETVGTLRGIAKGENIYAVRFLGDTAYLVTFYRTDPLFIVDLSDPQKPEMTGELKIPGFSNYLHPYSDTLLIGIGEDGTETGANGRLKISLFDVSDKQNPQEISKIVYDNADYSSSTAQSDHKAYLSFGSSGEFAVPVREYGYFSNTWRAYISVLTVEDGTLKIVANYIDASGGSNLDISRATYAGNTVFALSEAHLTAFDKTTGEVLSAIDY